MNKKSKPKTGMSRLLELAPIKKTLVVCSGIFSALASLVSFVPYTAIYLIVQEVPRTLPDLASLDSALMIRFGWLAFAGVVGNILLYFAALVCSHLAPLERCIS